MGQIHATAAVTAEEGYRLHPALLDAHLQIMSAALPNQADVFLPFDFERVRQFSDAQPTWCHVQIADLSTRETLRANLTLFDDHGMVVVQIDGITLKRANRAALQRPSADIYANWLYQPSWEPVPMVSAARQSTASPLRLAGDLDRVLANLYKENDLDEYVDSLLPEFDRLTRIYIINAFLRLGWQPAVGQTFTTSELADRLQILPQHRRMIDQLLRILTEDGILQVSPAGWIVCQAPQIEDAGTLHTYLQKLFPQYSGELEITGRCGAQFAEALTGSTDPLQLLFPGGSFEIVERIYQKSPAAKTYNGLVRAAVEKLLAAGLAASGPTGQKLRVLEIGAGTGGTSSFVLPILPAGNTEYTFTDISPIFTERARQKFSQYPFVRYQPLDIEQDPYAQGLAGQQFELIIAANVIHATRDLHVTLQHVRKLLAPDGMLIMLEVTAPQRWVDITFGMTDGWWRFSDKELRPAYPLLSRAKWIEFLQSEGFAEAATIPQVNGEFADNMIEEAVILARAPGMASATDSAPGRVLILDQSPAGQPEATTAELAELLRQSGIHPLLGSRGSESFSELIANGTSLDQIVFLGTSTLPQNAVDGPQPLTALQALLPVVQAAVQTGAKPPRLWVVTAGAQATPGFTTPDPAQAALWGFTKTVALEHPELGCTSLDLDPADPNPAATIFAEVTAPTGQLPGEPEIALRGATRLAARLSRYSLPTAADTGDLAGMERKVLEVGQPGDLDSLHWKTIERSKLAPNEVEIFVQATGLNFKDVMMALGMYPGVPTPLGGECAGIVSAVGAEVSHLQVGDPVMAIATASFGSHALAEAQFVFRSPANLSVEQAATVLIPYITASFALNHLGQIKPGEKVLIHAGAGGVGFAAIQLAQRCGAEIFATAGSPEKRAYLQSIGVQHVLDSRSLSFADEIMRITAGRGVDIVLNSLAGEFIPRSLGVLTSGGRFLEIGKSGLLSPQEAASTYPHLHYHVIDWTEQARSEPELIAGLIHEIVKDLASGALQPLPIRVFQSDETVAAFRYMQQARHIGKIVVRQPTSSAVPLVRSDASYLITGGLRGLGWLTAKWLVDQGARHLALLGRSQPGETVQSEIEEFRRAGLNILVLQGDVSSEEDLRGALDQVRQSLPPLRGVIHSAGRLEDGALLNQTWSRFESVLEVKVTGAALLHQLTLGQPLDFFVLYSSIASIFGSRGQANHSAANAYLDAFAHARRAQGLPALSINWGVWAEVGAAADRGMVERSATQGIESISPELGLSILGRLMRSPAVQAVVCPLDWPVFLQQFGDNVPAQFSGLAAEALQTARKSAPRKTTAEQPSAPTQPEFLRRLAETPVDRRRKTLLEFVQKQTSKVLGIDAREVNEQTPLNEMGLNSLMAVELRNLLGKALDLPRPLPVTLVFDYPTVTAVTDYLANDILKLADESHSPAETVPPPAAKGGEPAMLDTIEDLSDDDVDRLLSEMTKGKE